MNPSPDTCGASRSGNALLSGSLKATPTSTDAEPTPSSDDDTTSTTADDAMAVAADAMCDSDGGASCRQPGEVIRVQGVDAGEPVGLEGETGGRGFWDWVKIGSDGVSVLNVLMERTPVGKYVEALSFFRTGGWGCRWGPARPPGRMADCKP